MKEKIIKLKQMLKETKKTYITLEELEKNFEKESIYVEKVTLIKQFINDGILKPIRKEYEW